MPGASASPYAVSLHFPTPLKTFVSKIITWTKKLAKTADHHKHTASMSEMSYHFASIHNVD